MTGHGKQTLFNYFGQEFNVTPLETELQEIEQIVLTNQEPDELTPLDMIGMDLYFKAESASSSITPKRWLHLSEEERQEYRALALMKLKNFRMQEEFNKPKHE